MLTYAPLQSKEKQLEDQFIKDKINRFKEKGGEIRRFKAGESGIHDNFIFYDNEEAA